MQRLGRKNRAFFRINAIDQRTRRNGSVIESLGWYDPIAKDPGKQMEINEERVKYWLSVGAQPSDTVRDFLAKRGMGDLKLWEADRAAERKRVEAKKAKVAAEGDNKDDKKA
jgi:small subunit ribosomal protein S16